MNKIGIVLLKYWLGVSPSIIQTAKTLAGEGFSVDIVIDGESFYESPADFPESNINIIKIGKQRKKGCNSVNQLILYLKSHLRRDGRIVRAAKWMHELEIKLKVAIAQVQYFVLRSLKGNYGVHDVINTYFSDWSEYLEVLTQRIAQENYFALIGVEPKGLVVSCYALERTKLNQIHLIYYNLELFHHNRSLDLKNHLLKDVEIICSDRCDFIVIPDADRGNFFARTNRIEESRMRYLPISTSGDPVMTKSRYFRDLFNIADDKRIVLYAGNICEWAMCREIVESVEKWPNEFILVMHTWRQNFSDTDYYRKLVKISNPKRVYFSTEPVAYEKLPDVLSSADVGLLFYIPKDVNFTKIGSSSNKLAQYVQVGLPIIASDSTSIRRVFHKYGNGICVDHPSHIGDALEVIFKDYDGFRRGAYDSYRSHYNFSEAFRPILSELKVMAEKR